MQNKYADQLSKGLVIITIARNFNDQTFRTVVKNYGWTIPAALDLGNATSRLFGVTTADTMSGVVIDASGQIVAVKGFQWVYNSGPDAGKTVVQAAVDKVLAGAKTDGVPDRAKPVAELVKRGQYGAALALANKLADKPADLLAYRESVVSMIENLKKSRLAEIESLLQSDKKFAALLAYECLVKAFPGDKEVEKLKATFAKIKDDPALKREFMARDMFYKAAELSVDQKQRDASVTIFQKLRQDYADTVFGKYVSN